MNDSQNIHTIPTPALTFTRDDLSRARKRSETIQQAIAREVAQKFAEWLETEIRQAWEAEHPGETVPESADLAQWAVDECFGAHAVEPRSLSNKEMHTRRFILFRNGEKVSGLELNLESVNLTEAEAAIVHAKEEKA